MKKIPLNSCNCQAAVHAACLMAFVVGCQSSSSSSSGGSRENGPSWRNVSIGATTMQSGFKNGSLRAQRNLSAFRISKFPVTWAEFDACTAAGQCEKADSSACGDLSPNPLPSPSPAQLSLPYGERTASGPAICVGESQAEAYCSWVGGRLPTPDEWLLAARGPSPQEFSFGDSPTNCDQHPMVSQILAFRVGSSYKGAACFRADAGAAELAVGKHPRGASPVGVEDVLLAPGELLKSDAGSVFNACAGGNHCVVFGLEPAAIDAVEPFYQATGTDGGSHPVVGHPYAFRCVVASNGDGGR